MKNVVVTGSLAYDHLMTFDGNLKDSIINDSDTLSVAFTTNSHCIDFGGCSGNIAYSLRQLGVTPIIIGIAGNDFDKYEDWLKKNDISAKNIYIDNSKVTAAAHILTDSQQNQFTMFSPGAMQSDDFIELQDKDYELAILSPEMPSRMLKLAKYFIQKDIPYIFDPGQMVTVFKKKEDMEFLINNSIWGILNEYEASLINKNFGDILHANFIIKTLGEKGVEINGSELVPAQKVDKIVDSTGCGDAFRAGFISGFVKGLSLIESSKVGCKVAAASICKMGTQRHLL